MNIFNRNYLKYALTAVSVLSAGCEGVNTVIESNPTTWGEMTGTAASAAAEVGALGAKVFLPPANNRGA